MKLEETKDSEKQAKRHAVYDKYVAEHATLVDEIRTVYPKAANEIRALLERMLAFDRKFTGMVFPRDAKSLGMPEQVARSFGGHQTTVERLADGVRLPSFAGTMYDPI